NDVRHSRPEEDYEAIVKRYDRLEQCIKDFDHQVNIPLTLLCVSQAKSFVELGFFLKECRQLGRSYALILATRDLREGLEKLLAMFHENTSHLAPHLPERRTTLSLNDTSQSFYFWLKALATVCNTFRERLDEFREYTEESAKVKNLMMMFSEHLMNLSSSQGAEALLLLDQYRASCLRMYKGVPAMQYEQKRANEVLITISTVSTFFSAVTATTLQTSLSIQGNDESNPLVFVVNTFWFCSLVFSIGSALHSLLAVVWKRTPYGSRGRRLPVPMTISAHGLGPAFLAISILSFSAGLVLFAFSSGQKSHTKIVTLVSTAITSIGLFTMAAWFGYEQYIAPLLLPNEPWRPFGKRIHEWKSSVSEKSRHLIHAGQQRIRKNSLSSHSIGSTRSNSPFRSPPTDEAQNQARMRLKRGIRLVLTLKALSTALKERLQTDLPVDAMPIASTTMDDKIQIKSPFLLTIPDKPLLTIPLPDGVIQDIEYSPNGKYLATTW
ncbi:hypothetical protein C0993_008571, partial [Termitomyces sp. T159_Od127]